MEITAGSFMLSHLYTHTYAVCKKVIYLCTKNMHISMYISSILWSQITNAKFFIFSFLKITNLFALNNATSVVYTYICTFAQAYWKISSTYLCTHTVTHIPHFYCKYIECRLKMLECTEMPSKRLIAC